MSNVRLIPRLDIKGEKLIKGVHLEGLRVLGDPQEYAVKYYEAGADELIYMDVVASLYGRNHLGGIIRKVAENVFIPITVGGGIRSVDDVKGLLRSGADKVAINTAAVGRPELLSEVSNRFGKQCVVLSVEAKRISDVRWEVYTDNGRERTGLDVLDWVDKAVGLGIGEILLTSIDKEGTREGFDLDLVKAISTRVPVPVIASGGMGSSDDLIKVVKEASADAVAMADILHYDRSNLLSIRKSAFEAGLHVRAL